MQHGATGMFCSAVTVGSLMDNLPDLLWHITKQPYITRYVVHILLTNSSNIHGEALKVN